MVKNFCDICNKEIKYGDFATKFKLKRQWISFHECGWKRLHVHHRCWEKLCEHIREEITNETDNL